MMVARFLGGSRSLKSIVFNSAQICHWVFSSELLVGDEGSLWGT